MNNIQNKEFITLGHNKGVYYYYGCRQKQVISFKSHSKMNLMSLSSLEAWGSLNIYKGKNIDWDRIASLLTKDSCSKGVFVKEESVRGIGAWLEGKNKIYHLGNKIIFNGEEVDVLDNRLEYIYEISDSLEVSEQTPLQDSDSIKLLNICKDLPWKNSLDGKLLAGWFVTSFLNGILEHNTNIWIIDDGDTNSRCIIRYDFFEKIFRKFAPSFLGLEFLNQKKAISLLQQYRFPILFEKDRPSNNKKIKVIDLIDKKSLPTFCFLSDHMVAIPELRKQEKIVILNLSSAIKNNIDLNEVQDLFTKEFRDALFYRIINNIDTILKNISIFTEVLGERKTSNLQIATLLSGAWLCNSVNEIKLKEAKEFIK